MFLNDWSKHCYDFISDYECIFKHPVGMFHKFFYGGLWDNLQAAKQRGTCISIVNIAHFTKLPFACEIVESGGFKGGMKKISEDAKGRDVEAKFSWWSPIFFEDDIKRVRDTLGEAIQPFLDELSDQFRGDGSNQDDEIDSDQDTEKGGDQDNEEGSDQGDEIDSDQDPEKGSDQDNEEGSDQNDEIDSDQDTEKGGDQDMEEGSDQNDEIDSDQDTEKGSDQDNEEGSDQDDDSEIDSDQDTEKGGDQDMEGGSDQDDEIDQEGSEKGNDDDDDHHHHHHHHQDDDQNALTPLKKQFASSNAFNPNAQSYGNFYFQYNINYLCDRYRFHFGGNHEVQFKVLGTFSYKKEVMHAVLVCSQKYGDGLFKKYPPMLTPEEDKNEAVVTRDNDGNWLWKPQATGSVIKRLPDQRISYPKFRRWEHVAFAFHIPDERGNETLMSVPDLRLNLHYLLS